jgi:hypothetical protein
MNIIEAIDDPHLLGASIRDPATYRPWRALFAAALGLPLDDYGADLFRQCTGRTELPTKAFGFLWLICGRRSGKSFAMALLAVFFGLFRDWQPKLAPGERAIILLVAVDREQAKIVRRYISGILETPILHQMVEAETADTVELKGRVVIEVVTCSYRAVRGRSVCVAILDEAAFFRSENTANVDTEVFNAIRASMATFGDDAMMIIGSSPYARRGLLWDAYRRWHGRPDTRNLVWQAATWLMNPTVPQEFIDNEMERDPASAAAEYGAEFRTDIEAFVSREVVESCTVPGRHELPPVSGFHYLAFTDPSGGSSDSFTLAIAHHDKATNRAILDVVRERKPPFSPDALIQEYAETLKTYGVRKVQGDRYAGEFPRERFRVHGISYELSEKPKSDIYRDCLPLLNSGRVELLDNPRLIAQLCGLERRTARGGRDSIDHGIGGHDDLANSVAGALLLASGKRRFVVTQEMLDRASVPLPRMLAARRASHFGNTR